MKDLTLPTPALPPISDEEILKVAGRWFGASRREDVLDFARALLSSNHEDGGRAATAAEDARRYRWLRAGNYPISLARSVLNDTPHGIDAAIDAAIASQPPRGV